MRWTREQVHSLTRKGRDGWESTQWLLVAGTRLPDDVGKFLLEIDRIYGTWIERFTAHWIRIHRGENRQRAALGSWGWPVGLELSAPELQGCEVVRRILDGLLVAEESGELAHGLRPVEGGVVVYTRLNRFRPRMDVFGAPGRWLYAHGQSVIHRRLSRGFLRQDFAPRLLAATDVQTGRASRLSAASPRGS